jgi:hypothetical protein
MNFTHHAIDSYDFTEDDAMVLGGTGQSARCISFKVGSYGPDEILGPYTRSANTTTEDGRAGDEDSPGV